MWRKATELWRQLTAKADDVMLSIENIVPFPVIKFSLRKYAFYRSIIGVEFLTPLYLIQ